MTLRFPKQTRTAKISIKIQKSFRAFCKNRNMLKIWHTKRFRPRARHVSSIKATIILGISISILVEIQKSNKFSYWERKWYKEKEKKIFKMMTQHFSSPICTRDAEKRAPLRNFIYSHSNSRWMCTHRITRLVFFISMAQVIRIHNKFLQRFPQFLFASYSILYFSGLVILHTVPLTP